MTRSCVERWLLGCLAGWRTTPQWMRSGFEHHRASATAMEPPPDGAHDGPAHGSPWTMQVVKAIIKRSGELQNDLCGKRLVGNFLERCDTPLIRKPGFSTTNGCWLFDEIEGDVRFVVPHADHNVYLSIPHPAGDPVMAANKGAGVPPHHLL